MDRRDSGLRRNRANPEGYESLQPFVNGRTRDPARDTAPAAGRQVGQPAGPSALG